MEIKDCDCDCKFANEKRKLFRLPLVLVRVCNYEYWPFWILFFPATFYWFWLSLRNGSFTYFTAANPGIDLGGFFGESKSAILEKVPRKYRPRTLYFSGKVCVNEILDEMKRHGMLFPIICKPDKGEMGFHVRKILSERELDNYLQIQSQDLIVQDYISYPLELGILYYRFPDKSRSGITSIAIKKFLSVIGDGEHSVEELLFNSTRARFQIPRLKHECSDLMMLIPRDGEEVLVEPIGNHSRGTEFVNGNYLITSKLVSVFDEIASNIDGIYYGRFDLKVTSLEDLNQGCNIAVMEINGTTSEPAHIYDKGMNLISVYRDIFFNMRIVNDIARMNRKRGIPFVPISEVVRVIRKHFKSKRNRNA